MLAWSTAAAADDLDVLIQRSGMPPQQQYRHGYSDHTDPVGRFMDLLAAGAIADARALRPDACRVWTETRHNSAWTGKFWVWNVQADMDTLCGRR